MERRTSDRTGQQVADDVLQNPIGREPDGLLDPLGLQVFIDIRIGEAGVGPEM
jgi:hypothetical protein